jgi:Bacterial type III secretion protein (HrpB7)
MNEIRSLRTLVGVRRREGKRLEERLAQRTRELEERRAEDNEALAAREQSVQRGQDTRDEREALLVGPFVADALIVSDFATHDRGVELAAADKVVGQTKAALELAEKQVEAVRAEVRRNQQRVERFEERMAEVLREREYAIEEAAEEETTETAAARFGARQRSARQADSYD